MVAKCDRHTDGRGYGTLMEQKQLIDTLLIAVDNALANLHTATIARVTKVNASTISCRPITNRVVDGESIALPEFIEVPVLTMQGGGSYTAYPIAVDDYCLLIFTERCFDRWYDGQDYQPPLELRMHDYSDGIAIVGVNPLAGAINIPTVIHQEGESTQTGDLTVTGNIAASADASAASFTVGTEAGASGTIVTQGGQTLIAVNGIVTSIT